MATLTGFKSVADASLVVSSQQQNGGQQNPVFVFDDTDVGDGPEVFVDAQSDQVNSNQPPANKQQPAAANQGDVAIAIAGDNQAEVPAAQTPPTQTPKKQPSATGNQIHKSQQQHRKQATNNSLAPNNCPDGGDQDSHSVNNMLAVDCSSGAGKSPRTPRRSPLMALFRGKPRESVRRLYTDEDQFEIEWANLSLEVQRKWYQKLNLSNLLQQQEPEAAGDEKQQNNGARQPQNKLILNGVDGRIRSGEITAVLGPSGAGKTSLLNGLFGKYRTAVQGSIKVTGAPSKKHLTVCTIPQSDYLIGYLTTEESLWFASRLKNCEDDFNHDRNIERVIELLGLQRCRHTRINKLSGGQYKRVSIAQEMLSSPDILVLDEPTSGLDSLTCYRTVKVLRDLVEASKAHNLVNPMSIILTIHQPHREVLDLFHSVYVMAVGGMTLYQGPPGDMEDWINRFSGTQMPAQGYNPASFMVELASEEYGRKPIEVLVTKQREHFRQTTQHQYGAGQVSANNHNSNSTSVASSQEDLTAGKRKLADSTISLYPLKKQQQQNDYVDIDLGGASGSPVGGGKSDIDSRIMTPRSGKNSDGVFWRHVNLMSKRCFLSNTRDPLLFTIRVGAHIFIPLVVALIYGPKMGIPNGCPFYQPEIDLFKYASIGVDEIQEKHDDIRIQFQNVGLHFMVYYAFGLCMLAFTAISFPLIMHVLVKEIRNGWYSLSTFIVGKMLAELPMAIVLPPISVGIIYVMTGQPSSYLEWRYCVQSVILILIVMIAEAKGLVFGAVCMNSMQTAVFAASVSTVPFILLSGFLIRIREVPYVLQHFAKFSYFKHSVEALIITRYGYGMCPCDPALIPPGGTPRIVGVPSNIMNVMDYYVNNYISSGGGGEESGADETNVVGNNRSVALIVDSITTLSPEVAGDGGERRARRQAPDEEAAGAGADASSGAQQAKKGSFFDKLASLLTRANAFGYSIESCADVEPFTMKDMQLKDSQLPPLIGYLFLYIVILKFISYFIVEICIKLKL